MVIDERDDLVKGLHRTETSRLDRVVDHPALFDDCLDVLALVRDREVTVQAGHGVERAVARLGEDVPSDSGHRRRVQAPAELRGDRKRRSRAIADRLFKPLPVAFYVVLVAPPRPDSRLRLNVHVLPQLETARVDRKSVPSEKGPRLSDRSSSRVSTVDEELVREEGLVNTTRGMLGDRHRRRGKREQ